MRRKKTRQMPGQLGAISGIRKAPVMYPLGSIGVYRTCVPAIPSSLRAGICTMQKMGSRTRFTCPTHRVLGSAGSGPKVLYNRLRKMGSRTRFTCPTHRVRGSAGSGPKVLFNRLRKMGSRTRFPWPTHRVTWQCRVGPKG